MLVVKNKVVTKDKSVQNVELKLLNQKLEEKEWDILKLEAPVVHTWYIKSSPSRLAILLELNQNN